MPPALTRVLETCLYVDDMPRARAFYEGLLGLQPMRCEERITAYPVGETVLLLFLRGGTLEPVTVPPDRGVIPPHDGHGPLHFAFAVPTDAVEPWRRHLLASSVAIVGEVAWPKGGTSLYVHDPDGHVIEFASPGLWANY